MQLALLVQPLALPHPSEEPLQVMHFLDVYSFFCSLFVPLRFIICEPVCLGTEFKWREWLFEPVVLNML